MQPEQITLMNQIFFMNNKHMNPFEFLKNVILISNYWTLSHYCVMLGLWYLKQCG